MNNNNIASLPSFIGATSPFGSFGGGGVENIIKILFNLADVLSIILPVLLSIAFMTIIERKQLAAHQRRVGPNTVG
jgi:NADH:ubiquinone oxidoreductase subunit H